MEFFRALLVIFILPLILTAEDVTFGTLPRSCQEAVQPWLKIKATQPNYPIDGVYVIETPNYALEPYKVYCERDPNGGPHWAIIQRRINGSVDFFRNFTQYENGFGIVSHEFWLGLKRIHALTDAEKTELWIKLVDDKNVIYNAFYGLFYVGKATDYILNADKYSGNTTDSLRYDVGNGFSTHDHDRDTRPNTNCALQLKDGWWRHQCLASNLNGPYQKCNKDFVGLCFTKNEVDKRNIKYVHMAIRPVHKA